MTRRRLRLPAIALLAVAAPVLASQPDSASSGAAANIRSHARQFGASVKQGSTEFGRRVAHGAREAGQQIHTDMHQVGHSIHHWWDGVRSSLARA